MPYNMDYTNWTQNILLDGLVYKEKVKSFSKEFDHLNFKGSNGWFKNFKKCNNITFLKMCGGACKPKESHC